jgi:Ferritin-like
LSYLGFPRFSFAGSYQADVSSVNNDPEHYDPDTFQANYQLWGEGTENGWWNPTGSGAFRLKDCKVTSVVFQDGARVDDDPSFDPLIGLPVRNTPDRVEAKLVDLDPEQQMVSMIWGLDITVGFPGSGLQFSGGFRPAPFTDLWKNSPGGGSGAMSALYQSVLTDLRTGQEVSSSRLLQELLTECPDALSVRLIVDAMDMDPTSPTFTFGRLVGVIGPTAQSEPKHFVAARRLSAVPGNGAGLNDAAALVHHGVLSVDLGNSRPMQSIGGPPTPIGPLSIALLDEQGNPGPPFASITCDDAGWSATCGGVADFALPAEVAAEAESQAIVVMNAGAPGLSESADGTWLRADDFVFRMNPGDRATTTFYATQYGRPDAGVKISLAYDPSMMAAQVLQGPFPGPPQVGTPISALQFPTSITTGDDGTASITLTASNPGKPRAYIDGQVYGVTYQAGDQPPPPGSVGNAGMMLSVLVFGEIPVPDKPDWLCDARPILQPYANLYPVMKAFVDLSNYADLVGRRTILAKALALPIGDPNHMPVTRDLSASKRQILLKWLADPDYMCLDSTPDLMAALQVAVELEHSTIPPYLTALYSIRPGVNLEVAHALRAVVHEEMLHMALAANILTAIGGQPNICQPGFVPRYPTSLPGGLRNDLTVGLRRCSIPSIRDVFMSIERPEVTVDPVTGKVMPIDPVTRSRYTIGWFYDEICAALKTLHDNNEIEFGHLDRQVVDWPGDESFGSLAIDSLDAALSAIQTILTQGEGKGPFDPSDGAGELAHYYRFAEIVQGRRLIKVGDGFDYKGETIPFDPEGVYPMVDDPYSSMWAPGTRARTLADQFSSTYQGLLVVLQESWSGSPANIQGAVGIMFALQNLAAQLFQTPSGRGDGTTAGPCFHPPIQDIDVPRAKVLSKPAS